jgi:PAS domain S-box-containing protein
MPKKSERRSRVEKKPRVTLRLLAAAVEQSGEGIAIADLHGRLLFVNRAFSTMHGYDAQELRGKPISVLFAPEQVPAVQAASRQLQETGEFLGETWHVRRDGAAFAGWMHDTLLRDDAGSPVAVLSTLRDIPEMKRGEALLRQQHDFIRKVIDSFPQPFYVVEASNYRVKLANAAAGSIDLSDEPFCYVLTHHRDRPCDGSEYACPLQEVKRTKSPVTVEQVERDKNGGRRYIEVHAFPVFDDEGNVVEMIEYCSDITDRKRAEKTQRENEERFHSLVESSGEGILGYDTEMRFTLWNSSMERISGFPREEVIGRLAVELFPFLENVGEADSYRQVLSGRAARRSEMPFEEPMTGRKGYFESLHFPVLDHTGRVTGGMGLIRDITERKRTQEETRLAKERAEAASRAKGEFLATVSHELRTPMSGVVGGVRLLLDTPLTEEQRRLAEMIRAGGEAQLAVINDILDFSKIEAGKLNIESYPFDLRATVEEVVALMAGEARNKSIELGASYAPDTPRHVVGDNGRVGQVLTNLVGNALKFTKEGHVLVTVTSEEQREDAARFRVTVEDTGIGIPQDKVLPIFEKFTQVDSSTSRRFGGMGLGLAISKHLVTLMGGQIGVTSHQGKGSTFWFTLDLPLAAEPLETRDTAPEAPPAAQATAPVAMAEPVPVRVLVAEDNVMNQGVSRRMLERLDCRVDVAANGEEALEMLSRFPYDLVFMDCLMPGMDGFEATREIRRLEGGRRRIPIIAVTALAMKGDRERCLAAGMDDYVGKPVKLEHLQAALERWTRVGKIQSLPPLDPAAVARLRESASNIDDSFLEEIFGDFVNNATGTIDLLRRAAEARDPKRLTHAAHSLGGSSKVVGARFLVDICERLERLAKAGSLAEVTEWIDQLEREFHRVKAALVHPA